MDERHEDVTDRTMVCTNGGTPGLRGVAAPSDLAPGASSFPVRGQFAMQSVRRHDRLAPTLQPSSTGSRPAPPRVRGPWGILPDLGWRGGLLVLAFWTTYGMVTTTGLFLSPLRQQTPAPLELVGYTFLGAYTWALFTFPLLALTRRFRLEREGRFAEGAGLAGLGILTALLVTILVSFLSSLFVVETREGYYAGWSGMWNLARNRFPTDLMIGFVILFAGIARDYFLRHQARQEEANLLRAQLVESRLAILRTQLNPHFLFNTLNALSALVATDPRGVRRMIARLSEILRYSLDEATEPEITLEEEARLVRRYLEIAEIRYQGRLETQVRVEDEVRDALVPNLVLQPLVENAMKHGIGRAAGRGQVEVVARREGGDLVLEVHDTGPGPSGSRFVARRPTHSGGIGLRHTRERLAQIYGDAGNLELLQRPEGGTIARLRIPYHTLPALPRPIRTEPVPEVAG